MWTKQSVRKLLPEPLPAAPPPGQHSAPVPVASGVKRRKAGPDSQRDSSSTLAALRCLSSTHVVAVSALSRPAYWATRMLRPRQPAAKRRLRLPRRVERPCVRKARLQARVLRSRNLPRRSMLV